MAFSETTILVTRAGMGEADEVLKTKLITTYFRLLDEHDLLPPVICFYAEGVKLVVNGSPVIDSLKSLESKGIRIVLCNTCLKHYDLVNEVAVGIIGGMTDIIEAQFQAQKVITI